MFRYLDPKGLTSKTQQAQVFFYPGANSAQMLERLQLDSNFKALNKHKIKRIILLTGTNYIDSIYSRKIHIRSAVQGINALLSYLWSYFVNAKICVLNILPRFNRSKNEIINDLNREIVNICNSHGLIFASTEVENFLFSTDKGERKCEYFMRGKDNVHLNENGVRRLAKYIKYISHRRL